MRFKVSKPDGWAQYQGFYITCKFFICEQKVLWEARKMHRFHYLSAPRLNLAFTHTDLPPPRHVVLAGSRIWQNSGESNTCVQGECSKTKFDFQLLMLKLYG